jgi:hypothetical protein
MIANYLLIAAASMAAIYAIFRVAQAVRVYATFRGKRLVSCPETHQPAAVRVAAGKAAAAAVLGKRPLTLNQCSRWPERQDCPQDCMSQIEEAPKACLVWTIMNRWYEGRDCAYCRKPFAEIHWHDHPPALINKDGKTVQWNEIPAESLQAALDTSRPVCWSCHVTATFRHQHPELIVERRASSLRSSLYH